MRNEWLKEFRINTAFVYFAFWILLKFNTERKKNHHSSIKENETVPQKIFFCLRGVWGEFYEIKFFRRKRKYSFNFFSAEIQYIC